MEYSDPICAVKGIGEKKARLFQKLSIATVSDLIEYYPRDYKDRTIITKISDIKVGEICSLLCKIAQKPENIRINHLKLTKVKIKDDTGAISAIWFNMPYLKQALCNESWYYFNGKIENRFNKLTIVNPEFDKYSEEESLSHSRIVPVYRATKGLTQKAIRAAIHSALEYIDEDVKEDLPQDVIDRNKLVSKKFAVLNIHFPESNKAFLDSRKRLCFDEFFILQVALFKFKHKHIKETKGFVLKDSNDYEALINNLPFCLTPAQENVLAEIKADMESGAAMNRLIQGDVGSGKTIVAVCASYWTILNGYQAALMAPTEVLAAQHYETFSKMLQKYGIETVMLNGSMPKKLKDSVLSSIASGKAKMIIGTHAVISKAVIFNKLGLVITDEQHRFGVKQRGALSEKAISPHVLVMTATPIPRTLALILYGDLDISIIDALPPGRQEIGTWVVNGSYRKRVYSFLKKHVLEGRQAYIICPAIENKDDGAENAVSNKIEMQYLTEYIADVKGSAFKDYTVEGLHGRMKPDEKTEIMESFAKNEINILISTTVIEVGINVPNATVMIVENAERFGLSQLHQLRGRVGRGEHKSYCILISDTENDLAKQRLEAMKETNDGFVISEMDLKLRGSGDFFGTRQHGLPEMKIANLYKDSDILKMAEKSASQLVSEDPYLEKEENTQIALTIDKMFKDVKFGINL